MRHLVYRACTQRLMGMGPTRGSPSLPGHYLGKLTTIDLDSFSRRSRKDHGI